MDLYKAALLLVAVICTVASSTKVDGYSKTEDALLGWPSTTRYKVNNVTECAAKCDAESSFACQAFVYVDRLQECWTRSRKRKQDTVFSSQDYTLYEKNTHLMLSGYTKTERAMVYPLKKRYRNIEEVFTCMNICCSETSFTCMAFVYFEKHNLCLTAASNSKTGIVVHGNEHILYENTKYFQECVNGRGTDYRGTENKTKSGKICQNWEADYPHSHGYESQSNPLAGLEFNFCRNPTKHRQKPWCYTTDPDTPWEYCNIPECTEDCMNFNGEDYRGKIFTTENGFTCQRWDSQEPHKHIYSPTLFPKGVLEKNYCRNPDGLPRPWCFTTSRSKRWDYCSIPHCIFSDNITTLKDYSKTEGTMVLSENKNRYTLKSVTECAAKCDSETSFTCKAFAYLERNQECWTGASNSKTGPVVQSWNSVLYEKNKYLLECVNERGTDYRGTENRTKSGKLCQRWDTNSPHKLMFTPQGLPLEDLESNFCRNPYGISSRPWCHTTDPQTPWEFCDIPSCTEECMHCRGEDYKGKISITENGYTCQRWDSQNPHNHGFISTVFPEKFLEENYCRNPNGDLRPWCYTSSQSRRWDYCSIPRCTSAPPTIIQELTCIKGKGESYRGAIAVTASGKTCQRWAAQTPHRHTYTPENYHCSGLDGNFCRNPGKDHRPWCYTTDPETRWEYCSVPRCTETPGSTVAEVKFSGTKVDGYSRTEGAMIASLKGRKYTVNTVTECAAKCNNETSFLCKSFAYVEKDQECWTAALNSKTGTVVRRGGSVLYEKNVILLECKESGLQYRGTKGTTKSGKLCQRWEANTPHISMFKPENYPLADLESNFCRNPDSKSQGPWCYTTDPETTWEHCSIPSCTEDCIQPGVEDYKGKTFITENGFICQRWDSMEPHSHGYTPKAFPGKFLEENYCRNPNADSRPWCYTTSPSKRWDYCSIPLCTSDPPPNVPDPPSNVPDVTCMTSVGESYRGTVAVTMTGETCQYWSAQRQHSQSYTPQSYPDSGLDENYCRNPNGEWKPWCYTRDAFKSWEYCNIPHCEDTPNSASVPERNCITGLGTMYRGKVAITKSGRRCQKWSAEAPYTSEYNKNNFGCSGLEKNYCRNPDSKLGPWCYTTDPAKPWEYCNLPKCEETTVQEDCMNCNGRDYRGNISRTEMGFTCQRWDSQTPHTHKAKEVYGDGFLDENYCRNPSRDPLPWCYTTDPSKRWDYCSIPRCTSKRPAIFHREVACITGYGEAYRGIISVTKNGNKCKRWSETPYTPEKYPCSDLKKNYCRNALGKKTEPWCYINDTEWELCNVEHCASLSSKEETEMTETLCDDY